VKGTIIILHGWGLSGGRCSKLQNIFVKHGYRVYAPDLPGFGQTRVPKKALVLSDYARYVHGYMRRKKITSAILFGHSFGGRVAIRFAKLYPGLVRALILTGTPGYTPVSRVKLISSIVLAKIGGKLMDIPLVSRWKEAVRLFFYKLVGAKEYYRAEGPMRQTFKNIVEEKLEENMKSITAKTLLLWGTEDTIVPLQIAERMKQTFPNATLVLIPKIGHDAPIRKAGDVAEASLSFIASI